MLTSPLPAGEVPVWPAARSKVTGWKTGGKNTWRSRTQILSMPLTRLVGLSSSLWSFLLPTQPHTTVMRWTTWFDSTQIIFLLSGLCKAVLPQTYCVQIELPALIGFACVSLGVSHIFVTHLHWWPSKSLLSSSAALCFLSPQSCHTGAVFLRTPHDSQIACLQIRKSGFFFLPKPSWLKSSKFSSSS